ncbi:MULTISPECIES: hypothetical protein [Luteimonas]|uniref:hypothetical protein n=1 Tax=Luteimonas TaxID=83614 RepID=UPI00117E2EAA|nr:MULTISPECIES: hypothetical protein [Luteimonas]
MSYRGGLPYRNPQLYRSSDTAVATSRPSFGSGGQLAWRIPSVNTQAVAVALEDADAVGKFVSAVMSDVLLARRSATSVPLASASAAHTGEALRWSDAPALWTHATEVPYSNPESAWQAAALPWSETATRAAAASTAPWRRISPIARDASLPWGQYAQHALSASLLWRAIVARGGFISLPWSRTR